jgi:MoaA/NifB/PqqE/SkfB family radical SAM enzyme
MLRRGKLSPRKLLNFLRNRFAYAVRSDRAAPLPSVLIAELTNLCNLRCRYCRDDADGLVDYLGPGRPPIAVGSMDFARYERILEEAAPSLLALVLYVSGEPLVHPDIFRMVRRASDLKVATVLSTNGMLLDASASERLLEAGVDCIKVVVSGFTQSTYERSHRGGDVSVVLRNAALLAEAKRRLASPAILVLDFIRFPYNGHEVDDARRFCETHGISFGVRAGFTVDEGGGAKQAAVRDAERIRKTPCDWLWTIMTVGWDGRVLACANCTFTSDPPVMGVAGGGEPIGEAWNGEAFRRFRAAHLRGGRSCHPLCRDCHYGGIRFQY